MSVRAISSSVDMQLDAVHRTLYRALAPQRAAVREILRERGLLYVGHDSIPSSLTWAAVGYADTTRFTLELGRVHVLVIDASSVRYGMRLVVPDCFLEASPRQSQELAEGFLGKLRELSAA